MVGVRPEVSAVSEFFDRLHDDHVAFIERQPMFFVATGAAGARINLSPKGMDSFRVLATDTVAYLDVGGSGNETQAHLAADGRITVMFCAFDNPALILRLYGQGRAVLPQDDGFGALATRFACLPGARQVFVVAVDAVQTSCGWGVPRMTLDHQRTTLSRYHQQQDTDAYLARMAGRTRSIDGLPVRPQSDVPVW